ncbi:hypothetical protein [Myroides odoratus]|uniref:hypothetical protein n=1 Tax=Myroides odoratus TaxID=256 RepID=UPI003341A86F
MKKRINKIIVLFVLLGTTMMYQGYAQTCENVVGLPINGTVSYNGIQVTTSGNNYVLSMTEEVTSCSIYTTPAGTVRLGGGYSGFVEYKMKFSERINDLVIVLNVTGPMGYENFNFASNGGEVKIFSLSSCYSYIIKNTIFSGGDAPVDLKPGQGGGGWFKISTPTGFTELKVTGGGRYLGSGFALCGESIVPLCEGNTPNTEPATEFTATGISDLQGFNNNWPTNIPNGFVALESKNQGFVITRVRSVADISSQDLVEGMLVYDISAACVKLFNGSTWKCIELDCGQ